MDDCRRTAERLTRYVDQTLPPDERVQVDQHLGKCPPCRDVASDEAAGRAVLRDCAARLRHPFAAGAVPPGLRSRCEELARAQCMAARGSWRATLLPVALATLLILFTGAAIFSLASQRSNALLAAQLTADHSRCFRRLPAQAASLDAGEVEAMLDARYGWDVHVPPSSDADELRLVQGKRCLFYMDGGIPHLLYRTNGQDVSLFVLEGANRKDADVTTMGHRARIWSRGANTFVLVSSASGPDVDRAAGYVRGEAH